MEFHEVSRALNRVESTPSRLEMADILSQLMKSASEEELPKLVYLLTGRLAPEFVPLEFGLSARLIEESLYVATRLSREEVNSEVVKKGDVGAAAESLLLKRKQSVLFTQSLDLLKVYDRLDSIARATGKGSQDKKLKLLAGLFHDLKPLDARYVARMVKGSLRIGSASMVVVDALSIAFAGKEDKDVVEEAYNRCSDLGLVATTLRTGGIEAVKAIPVTLNIPLKPMLAERLDSIPSILEKMGGKALFEFKYDGLRIQAHVGEEVKLFSRRLEDITAQFPELGKALADAFQSKRVIVEGEAVPVGSKGEFLPFQQVSRRRGRVHDVEETASRIPVKLVLFDALYMDGPLLDLPLQRRRAMLQDALVPTKDIVLSDSSLCTTADQAEEFFLESLERGCEGIMAKSVSEDSRYRAGSRGWQWIKFKADYAMNLTDSFDLVVVGGYNGRGRRTGVYGGFLMACVDRENGLLQTVCKLGSGFNDTDLANLKEKLDNVIQKDPPGELSYVKVPDVWFEPTLVLEVRAAELSLSPDHTAALGLVEGEKGLALRFPRFTGVVRKDKGVWDATDSGELVSMFNLQKKKHAR